jgi:hypothetical protein
MKWKGFILGTIRSRRIMSVAIASVSLGFALWFVLSLHTEWNLHKPNEQACSAGNVMAPGTSPRYIQFNIGEQEPVEPTFRAQAFMSLGTMSAPAPPANISLNVTEAQGYGTTNVNLPLGYDSLNSTYWMAKPVDLNITRVSGAHRDFPFDSASFDFDAKFTPAVGLYGVLLRNVNPDFYLPCSTVKITNFGAQGFRAQFEMRRNPLVQMTATVLMAAAFLFLVPIVWSVKKESVPTAIASYFFSLWSIRGILGSEMKTFPTRLDLAILCLCVLLVVSMGLRFAVEQWQQAKQQGSVQASDV